MVSDNEINTYSSCSIGRGEGAYTHIHANDEAYTRCRGTLDHVILHAVAVANAMRDMEVRNASAKFYCGFENYDGGGAIHVVVAIDQNWLFTLDGRFDAFNCCFHATHQIRRMQLGKRRGKELFSSLYVRNPAHDQQAGQNLCGCGIFLFIGRTFPQRVRQQLYLFGISCLELPAHD